jgi:hypothetical protein
MKVHYFSKLFVNILLEIITSIEKDRSNLRDKTELLTKQLESIITTHQQENERFIGKLEFNLYFIVI